VSLDVVTFGCRLNTAESDALRRLAEDAGLAGATVINTCAVTAESVRKARQAIRRVARGTPGRRIVVTGCAAQAEPETFAAMPEVSHVIGNGGKLSASTWRSLADPAADAPRVAVNDIFALKETAAHLTGAVENRVRAFVQVQDGCDHRCTFCIIPFGRGNSRSAAMGEVVSRIRALVADGAPEAVLTGVDLTSYGHDLPGRPTLGSLVRAILKHVPELRRLRLSSIDSAEADETLVRAFAEEERLMPHLHLSLQSGDDIVLKRMKRRHRRADAIAFCERLRRLRPDMVFGADLIAGFPTEDEAMFGRTLAIVDDCGLTHLHVFPFSARERTPAARMPAVPGPAIAERAARLSALGRERLATHLAGHVGREAEALAERGGIGRLADFTPVRLASAIEPGHFARARIAGHDGRRLLSA
jgi:threonylcarbamoyladenosine tRNA methylthiotransferase MtaB